MARIRVLSEGKDLLRCRRRKSEGRSQFKIAELGEEPRWRRNRTGRPLSLLQIRGKNN